MKYVWVVKVDEVVKRELIVGGKKTSDGDAVLFVESAGWYIRIGNLSFCVGDDEPPFKKDDLVKITLEHD